MAYSVITTPVTGTTISTTAFGIKVKDNFDAAFPLGVDAWTAYTPTLTQSGAVTKTVTRASYQRVGRLVTVNVLLTCTGSGTGANAVEIGLPVAAVVGANDRQAIGSGVILDASAGLFYCGIVLPRSTTTVGLLPTSADSANFLGVSVFSAALASTDTVSLTATYEAAS